MDWYHITQIVRACTEIAIIAFLIYQGLYFLRSTKGAYVLAGLVLIVLVLKISSDILKFRVIPHILDYSWQVLATFLIVIFQPELRRAFAQLGSYAFWSGNKRRREMAGELVSALSNLSKRKIGALIVLERKIGMRGILDDAVKLDAKLSGVLLESLFYPNSPLHDGAVIIRGERIIAARAILPLTKSLEVSRRMGTRHRAALGISEESDAVALVVSEETGVISLAGHGVLLSNLELSELEELLEKLFVFNSNSDEIFRNGDETHNGTKKSKPSSPRQMEEF